ncbi:tetratricopeptide repeat protein [Microbulbifer yueqingensis]|uniref:Tetratricopeptide repeat-containing protein n=1 Tax=Microbulbifer yueqingensis TaxID=658219 RepID=A0A1G8XKV5_9GAMM|nr:tetratricopeptide repeat protein [Microbulbifer yueqingensis]SDJ91106.1 Tetratricopeptide repeat-containing protein [Microbulbifer yueqingensis]
MKEFQVRMFHAVPFASPLKPLARAVRPRSCTGALVLAALLSGCAANDSQTIGSLQDVDIEIREERIDGSLEKALASYQKYLQETPETALTPEAMRRIADLKIKQAHRAEARSLGEDVAASSGTAGGGVVTIDAEARSEGASLAAPTAGSAPATASPTVSASGIASRGDESDRAFEERASAGVDIAADDSAVAMPGDNPDAALAANASEAIGLYRQLLEKYPLYERNDQVMYQLSRAYEETGQIDEAVDVLRQMVAKYPQSRHADEAYFRLGEYYFTRKKYLDAEESYGRVIAMGEASSFYEIALYKRGWAFFKQELYERGLDDFVGMLDYKVSKGYDFEQQSNDVERKHVEDTFRVVSLSFSYLGGAESIVDYFERKGERDYESHVYSHLGEYYLDKRRYQDAAEAYGTFVERNPLHRVAPDFSIRVIEIYQKGGFPRLVLESKKAFANTYALEAEYWTVFDISEYGEVVEFLQTNLIDLAGHYHAAYQNKRLKDKKAENYREAIHWYRSYLKSFSDQPKAPEINFQLAGLLLENRDFRQAGVEYERTAYEYPAHEKSSEAGYAAVYAYREHLGNKLKNAPLAERGAFKREIIRSSLKFAETFPSHKDAAQVMVGAVEDLYSLDEYAQTIEQGRLLLERFPQAKREIRQSAWLSVAHASFETEAFVEAEAAYSQVLALTPADSKDRAGYVDNLAASIYQQGDLARKQEDHATAAQHFLRIRNVAPGATILATAEYDAAAALILLEDWTQAAAVLKGFRQHFPQHKLIKDVTKKLAVVYQESGQLLLAAAEFERIERESEDDDVRREALNQAADLYSAANRDDKALEVLRRYVQLFPTPMEPALETRQKIAELLKAAGNQAAYMEELRQMVRIEAQGGSQRNDRTRYLAGNAALVLAEPSFDAFTQVRLVAPIEQNLNQKRIRMKAAIAAYSDLIDYQVADVTAAATYYLGEIYLHFSRALKESERPTNLSPLELEEYELALEEQIYPFEEKAISVHEKNVELLGMGIYNDWIEKTIGRLATLVPATYARPEEAGEILPTIVPIPEIPAPELAEAGDAGEPASQQASGKGVPEVRDAEEGGGADEVGETSEEDS